MAIKLRVVGANQTEVELGRVTLFFSYNTLVAVNAGRFYVTSHQYSKTTTRHINAWLHGANAERISQEALEVFAQEGY